MVKKVFTQIAFLCAFSFIVSVILANWGISYIVGAAFGLAIQFIGFNVFKAVFSAFIALKNKKLENERIKEFSYQGLEVTCPCYKQIRQFVPIKLNTANYYKCNECNKRIGVLITPETAIVTEPQDNSIEAINTLLASSIIKANANS